MWNAIPGVCALQQLNHGGWLSFPTLSTFCKGPPPSHDNEVKGAPDGVSTSNLQHNLHCCGKSRLLAIQNFSHFFNCICDRWTTLLLSLSKIDTDTRSSSSCSIFQLLSATTLSSILFQRQPCVSLGCREIEQSSSHSLNSQEPLVAFITHLINHRLHQQRASHSCTEISTHILLQTLHILSTYLLLRTVEPTFLNLFL
jgi:hypothetical protein